MEIAFEAIGIEFSTQNAFEDLTENVGARGELTRLWRESGVLHGRCLKLGEGLEVWSVRYESPSGEFSPADCRPAFRSKYFQKISPWLINEYALEGEAVIHGIIENTESEVLFELQNLTEINTAIQPLQTLRVNLCGLAYRAKVSENPEEIVWKRSDELEGHENEWSLCGQIIAFDLIRNTLSGNALFWIYLNLGEFNLEILVGKRAINREKIKIGSFIKADVWLQGHIAGNPTVKLYEGIDRQLRTADFWKHFKRLN